MDGVEEVIRIRIIGIDKRGHARWEGMLGQPHTGRWPFDIADLQPGDELVVAVEWQLTAWVPKRIVDAGGRTIVSPARPETDEEMWVPGMDDDGSPIAPGDLIIEEIPFSADDGSGRHAIRRPCVVVEVRETEILFRPIHSTGGALHKSGRGIKVADWQEAGLANSSVVSPDIHGRMISRPLAPARRVGRLTERDYGRILGGTVPHE